MLDIISNSPYHATLCNARFTSEEGLFFGAGGTDATARTVHALENHSEQGMVFEEYNSNSETDFARSEILLRDSFF